MTQFEKILALFVGLISAGAVAFLGVPDVLQLGGVRAGSADYYPTVAIGVTNPDVTQTTINKTICVPNWTATIRPPVSYTNKLKLRQMQALHLAGAPADYEEDHLISLQLGGAPADELNLWPEPYPVARLKDQVENYLKRQVCANAMTLKVAQDAVTGDWYKVYKTQIAGNVGAVDNADADDQ